MSIKLKNFHKCMLTKNDCYVRNSKEIKLPKNQQDSRYRNYYEHRDKIVVHSTGANNPWLKRYVQPDDGLLGNNRYNNSWNNPGLSVCVNAFIGKLDDGTIATYQTLPWNYRPWGVGDGSKGNWNNSAVQFEICEDDKKNRDYFEATFEQAAQLCAYLCEELNISVSNIYSHAEAHELGYGSNHGDPTHWWKNFNVTMDDFRARVKKIIEEDTTMSEERIRDICQEEIAAAKNGEGTGNHPSAWAKEATDWAVANGIINGFGGTDMGWQVLLTREQMAVMLHRFAKFIDKA